MNPARGDDAASAAGAAKRERATNRDPLPPIVSAALDEGGIVLYTRLKALAASGRGDGRYTVLGEIACGGMGRVLRVWDEHLQRELALKEMTLPAGEDGHEEELRREHLIARFVEEARINGQLDHPGIVPVHDIAVDHEGRLYFTMPLVRGYDLTRVFEQLREGREGWTLHRALQVLLEVTLAVAYAHSKGVIHRDLKPSNVMVGTFGETYVVDWGLALLVGRSARRGIVGTPAYMAPEQAGIVAGEVGPRSDVYSLGAILYHLCSGLMPHESSLREGREGGDDLLVEPPRPLHDIDPRLPPELVAICEKAMAWEPAERYASALGLAEDLRAWLEGRVVSAYDSSTLARLRKWRERNRGLAAALETICLLVVLSIAAVIWLQRNKLEAVAAANERIVYENYAANLLGAELGLKLLNADTAKRSLAACAPEHRGWEWDYLQRRADLSLATFEQGDPLRAVDVDPRGERMAAASDDGTIRVWDLASGRSLLELTGHEGGVNDLRFDRSGRRLVSASSDHTIRVWDLELASAETVLHGSASIWCLALSPDDARVAVGDHEGTIRIWDLATRALTTTIAPRQGVQAEVLDLGWSPDGARLYASDNDSLRTWDPQSGELLAERKGESAFFALAVDPSGALLAATLLTGQVRLLDALTLAPVRTLAGHGGLVRGVAFDASGARLVTGSVDLTVGVWDVASGAALARFLGHTDTVNAVAFLPGAERFVSGSADRTARLWDLSASATRILQAPGALPDPVALSPDGRQLAAPRGGELLLIDTRTGAVEATIPAPGLIENIVFSPDGRQLACASADRTIRVHDLELGRRRAELASGVNVRALAFSPDGTQLLSRGQDQILQLTDIDSGEVRLVIDYSGGLPLVERPSPPRGLAFAPDGRSFAVGMLDGRIDIVDARSGQVLQRLVGHENWINALAWGLDGKVLVSCSADFDARLWDLTSGTSIAVLSEHTGGVAAALFIDGGRRLVTTSLADEVCVWDTGSAKLLLSLPFGDLHVVAVAFDAAEGRLVAASADHRVRSWTTRPAAR